MRTLTNKELQEKRAQAQAIAVTLHVGKNGISEATVAELKAQLHRNKLVKVRLLPSATEGGQADDEQAKKLAEMCQALLVETRGHTAVYWRG